MKNLPKNIENQILEICNKYKSVEKVILFGSRARSNNQDRSDIDLAIYFKHDEDTNFLLELYDIETLLKVDITVMSDELDKKFIENVKQEGITVWENS